MTKVDGSPLRVGHAAVVENLQQDRGDVGVRFLDFVEKHHAVRAAAHRFGQLPRLVVAGISRRRAEQTRDGVRFGELREVDANQRGFAAEERFGERFRELGFTDSAGAAEEERSQRLTRIVQPRSRPANGVGNRRDRAILTDDSFAKIFSRSSSRPVCDSLSEDCGMPVQRVTTAATSSLRT